MSMFASRMRRDGVRFVVVRGRLMLSSAVGWSCLLLYLAVEFTTQETRQHMENAVVMV